MDLYRQIGTVGEYDEAVRAARLTPEDDTRRAHIDRLAPGEHHTQ
ncbi:hypothetical protein [Streptomyces sp. NBC_00046]